MGRIKLVVLWVMDKHKDGVSNLNKYYLNIRVTVLTTPNSNTKNSATKICSKGWVAQKLLLIGNLTAALKSSKGWVRKDANLGLRTGCKSEKEPRSVKSKARQLP